MGEPTVLYFGCLGGTGHYYYATDGYRCSTREPWVRNPWSRDIDTGLCPTNTREQGKAALHHEGNWTALAFWDNSVDHRGNSHSTFVVNCNLDFESMMHVCRSAFPQVFARFKFEVVPA